MVKYRWMLAVGIVLLMAGVFHPAASAESAYFLSSSVEVSFGTSLDFTVQVASEPMLEKLYLFLQPESTDLVLLEVPVTQQSNELRFALAPDSLPLRTFGDVIYWFQAEFSDGTSRESGQYRFAYNDDRFNWRALQTDHFRLYWYEGDLTFATAAVNVAENSYNDLALDYGDVYEGQVIDLFLYGSRAALLDTLSGSAAGWEAAHADPELGQVLMWIAPGPDQRSEMNRQIPHELAHLFTYQVVGGQYQNQPVWLLEGLAAIAQLEQDPSYPQLLQDAADDLRLIPLNSLCSAFPAQGDAVYLAYAQSESFVRYLRTRHGNDALLALLREYASGTSCESGFQNVYGIPLDRMATMWQREVLGVSSSLVLLEKAAPWLLFLLLTVLLPIGLSLFHPARPAEAENA
ncbi:MAG: hypothetical protein HPY85_11215 [Anaerolineae bacterium]|nr:hypothetical protein [Anaerolineae bacterium]